MALFIAVIPTPSCCWEIDKFLSRFLTISGTAADISAFNLGACSKRQLSGMRYSFRIFSLFSFVIPFLSKGNQSFVKFSCILTPNSGLVSVDSPKADIKSGSKSDISGSAGASHTFSGREISLLGFKTVISLRFSTSGPSEALSYSWAWVCWA